MGPLRAAITRVFRSVYVAPADHFVGSPASFAEPSVQLTERDVWIYPEVRAEVLEDLRDWETIRRVPLSVETSANADANNLSTSGVPE